MVAPTRLTINPNLWNDKTEQVKSKIVCADEMRSYYNDEARKLKSYLEKAYQSRQMAEPQKERLKEALEQYYNPQKYNVETASEETAKPTLIALFDEFLEKHRLSDVRKKNYRVIKRGLQRYELYVRTTKRGQKSIRIGHRRNNGRHLAGYLGFSGKRIPLLRSLSENLRSYTRSTHAATQREKYFIELFLAHPDFLLLVQQQQKDPQPTVRRFPVGGMHIRNALLYHGRRVAQDLRHEPDAASATGRSA